MSKSAVIQKLEKQQIKKGIPDFRVGDTVRVHTRIIEGNKERIQIFTGTVIARKGTGISETFSVHRVAYGEGLERVFPLHSPRVAKIEVVKHGHVRRAKLYYLRGTSGKKAKVKSKIGAVRRTEEEILKIDEEEEMKAKETMETEEIADEGRTEEETAESTAQS